MKALIHHGPDKITLEDAAMPKLNVTTDAVVHMTKTTICDTDLHTVAEGGILGPAGIGIVEEVGPRVTHCKQGGWILGDTIDDNRLEAARQLEALPSNDFVQRLKGVVFYNHH